MSAITTHILDTSRGRPAGGLPVRLELQTAEGSWKVIGGGTSDADGRVQELLPPGFALQEGFYRLTFTTGAYFAGQGVEGFYSEVTIAFTIRDPAQHYHVPLLLSPF